MPCCNLFVGTEALRNNTRTRVILIIVFVSDFHFIPLFCLHLIRFLWRKPSGTPFNISQTMLKICLFINCFLSFTPFFFFLLLEEFHTAKYNFCPHIMAPSASHQSNEEITFVCSTFTRHHEEESKVIDRPCVPEPLLQQDC